jgi:hypothetical protein
MGLACQTRGRGRAEWTKHLVCASGRSCGGRHSGDGQSELKRCAARGVVVSP